MRKGILLIYAFMMLFFILNADYKDAYSEIFFGRQPSSRAEALGRGYVTVDNDLAAYFYNPAGVSNIDHLQTKFTTASPYYFIDKGRYYQYGIGYDLIKDIVVAFNVNYMTYGKKYSVYGHSFELKKVTPTIANYNLTLATPLNDVLSVGCNINYFNENYLDNPHSSLFFDLGTIYKHKFQTIYAEENKFLIGLSIRNFTFSKVKYDTAKEELPVISRIGMSYSFLPSSEKELKIYLQTEYKYLLNYDYRDGLHSGIELKFFDIFALRFGYYYENIDDHGSSENADLFSEFTYGFGVEIPILKYVHIPLQLQIDYTNLKQPSYKANYDDWDNFESITVKLELIK